MTADATDADDPDTDNAALRYSILEQGTATMFSINATTGEICTTRSGLDREVAGTGGHGQHWGSTGTIDPPAGETTAPAMSSHRCGDRVGDHQLRDLWAPGGAGGAQHQCPIFPRRLWGCTT